MKKPALQKRLPIKKKLQWKIGIVASTYYKEEIDGLIDGAKRTLITEGVSEKNIFVFDAPGSFEIPLIGKVIAKKRKVDALIGFGIILEGETHHARLLAETVSDAVMQVQLEEQLPFAFEVLYVDSLKLAQARSKGKDNRGIEAANAVLKSLETISKIRRSK